MSPSRRLKIAAIAGLVAAWGGTALLVSSGTLLGEPGRVTTALVEQAVLWLLFAAVLAIVLLWERLPLASLWLQPFRWQSVGWGLLLAAALVIVVFPAREWVRRAAGLPGYAAGMEQVLALPVWVRVLAVIGAGIVEDTLFMGYAVTRLILLTGRVWLAAALALAVFCALHVPVWGPGAALAFFAGGVPMMAFFIWRRDLLAMIVAHITIDAWGIVLTPLFSEWWTEDRFR